MATTIIDVGGEKQAELGGSVMCRKMSFGTTWTKIRLGVRMTMPDTGASISSTPRLALGVCSGTANPYNNGSATTANWVGAITDTATLTYSVVTSVHYQLAAGSAWKPGTRVGTTLAVGSALNNSLARIPTLPSLMFVDILKGSPFSVTLMYPSNHPNATKEHLETYMPLGTLTFLGVLADYSQGTTRTMVVDEVANGYLDSFCFSWDRTFPKLKVHEVAVARLA